MGDQKFQDSTGQSEMEYFQTFLHKEYNVDIIHHILVYNYNVAKKYFYFAIEFDVVSTGLSWS